MANTIIVITGRTGSGKTTISKELQRYFGCCHIGLGSLIRRHSNKSLKFKQSYDEGIVPSLDLLTELFLSAFPDDKPGIVVVDGSLKIDEVLCMVREARSIDKFISVCLHSSFDARYYRFIRRNNDSSRTEEGKFFEVREKLFDNLFPKTIDGLKKLGEVHSINSEGEISEIVKKVTQLPSIIAHNRESR